MCISRGLKERCIYDKCVVEEKKSVLRVWLWGWNGGRPHKVGEKGTWSVEEPDLMKPIGTSNFEVKFNRQLSTAIEILFRFQNMVELESKFLGFVKNSFQQSHEP